MRAAIEELDMDQMGKKKKKMDDYDYEGPQQELFEKLKEAVEDVDVDTCEAILKEWEEN